MAAWLNECSPTNANCKLPYNTVFNQNNTYLYNNSNICLWSISLQARWGAKVSKKYENISLNKNNKKNNHHTTNNLFVQSDPLGTLMLQFTFKPCFT